MLALVVTIVLLSQEGPLPSGFLDDVRYELDSELLDYTTARFRGVRISTDASLICGEVNARSTEGGYIGWKEFVVEIVPPAKPNFRLARAEAVGLEFRARCEAWPDWRPTDYTEALTFD